MNKKQDSESREADSDCNAGGPTPPALNRNAMRKGAAHTSTKRKQVKAGRRKGKTVGGIHQRGDKRVVR